MEQVLEFFRELFGSEHFMPRWVCGKWTSFHGWLYIISDIVIFLAYMAIPFAMVFFVRRRWKELPFRWLFWMFIAFISLCGTTHLLDAVIFYEPMYRLNALLLVATAVVSVITVGGMLKVMPQALTYKSPIELQQVVDEKTAELNEQIRQLNRLHDRVSRKKEQVERFAYITSHNLRAPAANLFGLLQLLDDNTDAAMTKEITSRALKSGGQLLTTLEEVSQVLVDSSPTVDATNNRFDELVQDILHDFESEIADADAAFVLNFKRCPELLYPRDHLKSIITNLISNTLRYRHPDRKPIVKLTTWSDGKHHCLTCEDNGLGIDLEKYGISLFHLYKTFHGHPEGKGVGLFLIRHQLESLDGEINIESSPGEGTKFTVRFGKPKSIIV